MKAMVLSKPGQVELKQVEQPVPAPGEVLIRVTYSGICGTDLKIFDGGMPARYPIIMGHEITGIIEDAGTADHLKPGMRVIVDPTIFCGTCFHCHRGETHLCPNSDLLGRERNGGFAEYVTAPIENIFPLPDSVSDHEAAFTQVFSTCVHAQDLAPIASGESVAVLGLGVTGQMHIQLSKAAKADPLIGITRSEWKRDLAGEFGANLTLAPGDNLKQQILDATDGLGADVVIETAGKVETLGLAMELARAGGRIIPFGIYTEDQGKLPFYYFYYKELQIISARASRVAAFQPSIDLVDNKIVELEPLITHVLPLDQLADALEMLAHGSGRQMKVIMAN